MEVRCKNCKKFKAIKNTYGGTCTHPKTRKVMNKEHWTHREMTCDNPVTK